MSYYYILNEVNISMTTTMNIISSEPSIIRSSLFFYDPINSIYFMRSADLSSIYEIFTQMGDDSRGFIFETNDGEHHPVRLDEILDADAGWIFLPNDYSNLPVSIFIDNT